MMFAPGQCMSLNRESIIVIAISNKIKLMELNIAFSYYFPLKVFSMALIISPAMSFELRLQFLLIREN